ncbi:hypothetical protein KC963_05465, partial [Candidatus Saccharibacteria bacterium]|nr:hypothetical protein [Candidatus Saccharibacteria bacterium]
PPFQLVYHDWLNSTVRVYAQKHTYTLDDELAAVQLVAHVYGRIGLLIHTPVITYAVYDSALACPAEGFMTTLLTDLATIMVNK